MQICTKLSGNTPVLIQLDQMEKLLGGLPTTERTLGYFLENHAAVEGWVEPPIFSVLLAIDAIQRKKGFSGGALEIGVHHGRFLIALANLCEPQSKIVAIDVFEDQQKNVDQSGKGDEAALRQNVEKYCNKTNAEIRAIKADSLGLQIAAVDGLTAGDFRFVSIDGGHTAAHTFNDLTLAEQLVSDGGVVFVDDILNHHWLGVMEGVMRYRLFSPGVLVPFLITANKMMMCKATHHGTYMEFFAKHFPMGEKKAYRWTGDFMTTGIAPQLAARA